MLCVRLPGKFLSSSCLLMPTPSRRQLVASGPGYGYEIAVSRADTHLHCIVLLPVVVWVMVIIELRY